VEIDTDRQRADPIGELLRVARAQRTACLSVERELTAHPDMRKEFSREEILTSRRFPFL
jgi:hypothetical protein